MIPRECKRLAEVDFPIAVVSKYAATEKQVRHGHPSTLHLWWARRPLAACRAVLLALLLPDPADPLCPKRFKAAARQFLEPMPGKVGPTDENLREAVLRFIGDFADWDRASSQTFLEVGRGLVKAAYPDESPLVTDPFSGGGSIPLEALRLGCEAYASDLNPVAALILKTMLEDISRQGPRLADDLLRVGAEIKKAIRKSLAAYYPPDADGGQPIAYIWARTVRCESTGCGAEIPLVRSFWLSKKPTRRCALRWRVERKRGQPPVVEFEVFSPRQDSQVPKGTVARAKAKCPCCENTLLPDRVREQLRQQRGGADPIFNAKGSRVGGARLLAVAVLHPQTTGRAYRLPTKRDYDAVRTAGIALEASQANSPTGASVPTEPLPPQGTLGFRVQLYGMLQWGDLFTARQKTALLSLCNEITSRHQHEAATALALVLSRIVDRNSALCTWRYQADQEKVEHVFARQALPPVWDFAEAVVTSDATGSWGDGVEVTARSISSLANIVKVPGQVNQGDACASALPTDSVSVWFTDPPYYDAVPYADLSDFFFVWLKRALPGHPLLRDPNDPHNPLTPKLAEAVQDETKIVEGRPKDREFFERKMALAFAEGRRVMRDDGIGAVVFAHKTTEGWEALLSGMTKGGWVITGSWPIATESATRLRARDSAALATSVHLICRPRTDELIGDWADVLRELPPRVTDWMVRLEREGVRGADLVFACIGPALEIFSRYARVETPDGREVPLAEYLEKVWEVVGRAALEQVLGTAEARARNGGAGALEEDARLTALFLWTLKSTASGGAEDSEDDEDDETTEDEEGGGKKSALGFSLVYDIARRFAQPLGVHLEKWEGRIVETDKGVLRMLSVRERAVQLFGEEGAGGLADRIDRSPTAVNQLDLFPAARDPNPPKVRGRNRRASRAEPMPVTEATTLDRVHAAMLLQAGGRTNALRALLTAEQDRGPDFLRLANSLSALYPQNSDEKRLLDAMLLAVPR